MQVLWATTALLSEGLTHNMKSCVASKVQATVVLKLEKLSAENI